MRIGIYDPYLDDCGGGEKYMLTIAEVLSKDHDVSIFWDSEDDLSRAKERFSLDLSKVKLAHNIFSSKTSTLSRILASRKYDSIIVLSDGSIPLLLSKQLFIHLQQPLAKFQKNSIMDRIKLIRVTRFFCNSEYTRVFLNSNHHVTPIVLYPPVELKQKKKVRKNHILHVGRFRPFDKTTGTSDYKKQGVMIKAFREMVDRGLNNWKLIMAVSLKEEDSDAFEKIKQDAKKYPIEYLVNKTNNALWDAYGESKIYWHASGYGEDLEAHPEFAEHFGISTVEAMGAGAVPVVFNAGGQKEIVTDGETGLLWNTIPELIEETLLLINSKDLLDDLSKNAKSRAKDFSKEEFARRVNRMISP